MYLNGSLDAWFLRFSEANSTDVPLSTHMAESLWQLRAHKKMWTMAFVVSLWLCCMLQFLVVRDVNTSRSSCWESLDFKIVFFGEIVIVLQDPLLRRDSIQGHLFGGKL